MAVVGVRTDGCQQKLNLTVVGCMVSSLKDTYEMVYNKKERFRIKKFNENILSKEFVLFLSSFIEDKIRIFELFRLI